MRFGHLDSKTSNSGALAGWLQILEEPSPGDTEWEQVVLCGGVFV